MGGGRRASVRDRRQGARRRGHHRADASRRGDEADPDQDRRALHAPRRSPEDDGELHLARSADAGDRRQGPGGGVRSHPGARPGARAEARLALPAGAVPQDDRRDRRGGAGADPFVERRYLPPRGLHRYDRFRRRADQDTGGADQARRSHPDRSDRRLARARGRVPGARAGGPRALRGQPLSVRLPRLSDLGRDARADRFPDRARDGARPRHRGRDLVLAADRLGDLPAARGDVLEDDVRQPAARPRVRLRGVELGRADDLVHQPTRRQGDRLHGLSAQRLGSGRAARPRRRRRVRLPAWPVGQGARRRGHRERVPRPSPLPEDAPRTRVASAATAAAAALRSPT